MNKGFKRSTIGIIVGTPSLFPLGLVIERHFEKTETWENVMFLGGCGGWGVGLGTLKNGWTTYGGGGELL